MISEHEFASSYPSIWSQVAPLSIGYWKVENMLTTRDTLPVEARAATGMRGVVNETAFRAFNLMFHSKAKRDNAAALEAVWACASESIEYVVRLAPRAKIEPPGFDDTCAHEAAKLAVQLLRFFPGNQPTVLRPKFFGCGLISECEGDVMEGDCLYEVKAGDRAFRITDLRQLLIYSALAYASQSLGFSKIGLFNPRTGYTWVRTLDEVCKSIAGSRPADVLSTLVGHFSAASVSR